MKKKVGLLEARRDAVMRRAVAEGLARAIASEVGLTYQAVQQWKRVPAKHVMPLVSLLKLSPEEIRPDVFKIKRASNALERRSR